MDAWEILVSNSMLQSGDVWEHLNAQGGGGGQTIIVESFGISVAQQELNVVLSSLEVTLEVLTVEVEVINPNISVVLENLEVTIDE
jgi:hypothetical protein